MLENFDFNMVKFMLVKNTQIQKTNYIFLAKIYQYRRVYDKIDKNKNSPIGIKGGTLS